MADGGASPLEPSVQSRARDMLRVLEVVIALALLGVVAYSFQFWPDPRVLSVAALGVLVGGGALLIGSLLGLLFAIPRALQAEQVLAAGSVGSGYRANTNLEQISDWLTKILVGVGLTQIREVPPLLAALASYIAPGLGGGISAPSLAVAILIFFSIAGFLASYLWARLYLGGAFTQADIAAAALETSMNALQTSQTIAARVDTEAANDTRVLSLVDRQLSMEAGVSPTPQSDLNAAVMAASSVARIHVYQVARDLRSRTWKDPTTKPLMERTIPVFRALIAADPEGKFHRNHAQLGYALKDQTNPAWTEAAAELTKAIEMRGDWRQQGYLYYEFNRAVCRIRLDPAFTSVPPRPSAPDVAAAILTDLRTAANNEYVLARMLEEPNVRSWMGVNQVSADQLRS
jgi:hypothetical protein